MKNKLLKLILSRWYLLIGVILMVLMIMPTNSPISLPYPDYTKPIVAIVLVTLIMYLVFYNTSNEK
jgi:MFS superfamily sulfate permease-like transporter